MKSKILYLIAILITVNLHAAQNQQEKAQAEGKYAAYALNELRPKAAVEENKGPSFLQKTAVAGVFGFTAAHAWNVYKNDPVNFVQNNVIAAGAGALMGLLFAYRNTLSQIKEELSLENIKKKGYDSKAAYMIAACCFGFYIYHSRYA